MCVRRCAYPGGFNVLANATGFTGIDGSPAVGKQQINFKTAGFASISIESEDGRKVKSFNQDIKIAMQFKKGTTDSDNNIVTIGNVVPIWSFDEETGEWQQFPIRFIKPLINLINFRLFILDKKIPFTKKVTK